MNIKKVLQRSAVHDVGFLTSAQYLTTIFGILTTVIAARILGPEDYGQASLISAFPSPLSWQLLFERQERSNNLGVTQLIEGRG